MTRNGLATMLRAFSDDQLGQLFRARPDVLHPVPAGFDQLASRMCTQASLVQALDGLDRFALAILEATFVLPCPASVARVGVLMGVDERGVRPTVDRLRTLGLVWGTDESLRVPNGLSDLFGRYPAGLGPPVETALARYDRARLDRLARDLGVATDGRDDPRRAVAAALAEPDRISVLLDQAGPAARAAAEQLTSGSPTGSLADADRAVGVASARTPAEQLLARGLLVSLDRDHVVLPREVGLVLRSARLYDPATLEPPPRDGTTRDPTLVDRTAAGTALELIRLVEQLLEAWGSAPPAVLRAGGLGVRDLRRAAKFLEVDETHAALLVECAAEAELLGVGGDDETWVPTSAYDAWRRAEPAERWARLAVAWFRSPRAPGLVGTRDERDRLRTALSPELDGLGARRARRLVLEVLGPAGPGVAVEADSVVAHAHWAAPRWAGRGAEDLVRQALTEAAALGVTGLGALSTHGRALGDDKGSDVVATALRPALPEPVDHVVLQADLTAVAPGPLRPELARELALLGDAESHGGATVYRFTEASVRRAFDHGQTAADVHELLARSSSTPVPQPLTYLVDDVARRHGHLRAGTATAYLRCDDEAALNALLADRRAAELRLRRIAPTVVVSPLPARSLVDSLREMGYAPVAEAPDGTVAVTAPRARRTEDVRRRYRLLERTPPDPDLLTAAVRAVRAGDRARASRPEGAVVERRPRTVSAQAIEALRAALSQGHSVWIGYVDQHGGASDRIVDPVRIEDGRLTAFDHAAGAPRAFALHRITGASPVPSRDHVRDHEGPPSDRDGNSS